MQKNWFDSANHYLVNPPILRLLEYPAFRSFYAALSPKKGQVLALFEDLCRNMKRDGVEPMGFVIGGEFLRNNKDCVTLDYLTVFQTSYQIHDDAIFKYCYPGGIGVASYNVRTKIMVPLGEMKSVKDDLNTKVLESSPKLANMQTRTILENSLHRVGVVAVRFQEVLNHDGK